MSLETDDELLMFHLFPLSLIDLALNWFSSLKPNFISHFQEFILQLFIAQYFVNKKSHTALSTLFSLKNGESLCVFHTRFWGEMVKMDKVDSTLGAIALKKALIEDTLLHWNLMKYYVEDIDDALMRVERYIRLEGIYKSSTLACFS